MKKVEFILDLYIISINVGGAIVWKANRENIVFFGMITTLALVVYMLIGEALPVSEAYAAEDRRAEIERALYNAEYYAKANNEISVE